MFLLAHAGLGLLFAEGGRRALRWKWTPALFAAALGGALVADVIDKPLGQFILMWGTGRLWGHTLLLLAALIAASLVAYGRPSARLFAAAAVGDATHLLLDRIWEMPAVALWPLLGPMPHGDFTPATWVSMLERDPLLQLAEVVGGGVLLVAAWAWRRYHLKRTAVP